MMRTYSATALTMINIRSRDDYINYESNRHTHIFAVFVKTLNDIVRDFIFVIIAGTCS